MAIPGTSIIYAKWPEKRNGGRNGKKGAKQPTNVKAMMVRQCGMCKDPRRHQTQKHQTRKSGLRASHVVRYQSAQSPLQGQHHYREQQRETEQTTTQGEEETLRSIVPELKGRRDNKSNCVENGGNQYGDDESSHG
jgi:hypothetical protein